MEYLDAHQNEILARLMEGEWKELFPKEHYNALENWFQKHQKSKELVVRLVCQGAKEQKFAVYFICSPKVTNGKVRINDLKEGEVALPLAIPPALYEVPLYCMPEDFYSKMLGKRRKSHE